MQYRKEIDGLRAVALCLVILFHAWPQTFSGGYLGVDVFFVISGYLITSIIVDGLEARTFLIWSFYEKRARRMLPALFVVMAVTSLFSYLWMLPDDLKNYGQSVFATALFSNNVLLAFTGDYWAIASEFKPLLHTWSLGVEEQYYLAFPLMVTAGWILLRRQLVLFLGVTAGLSFIAAHWGLFSKPQFAFYLLPPRAWEILVGSLAAFYMRHKIFNHIPAFYAEILGLTGLLLIVAPACLVPDERFHSGNYFAVAASVGSLLIVVFSSQITIAGKVLSVAPLEIIGLISYSAYLWHQPLFALARVYSKDPPDTSVYILLIILTFFLAYLSWRFVENPCRNRDTVNRTAVVSCAIIFSAAFACYGLYLDRSYGIVSRIYGSSSVAAADLDKRIYNEQAFRKKLDDFPAGGKTRILIIGNSFGRDFVNIITETYNENDIDLIYRDDFGYCILPIQSQIAANLYSATDIIIFASGSVNARCFSENLKYTKDLHKKIYYVGTKDFGYNENWVMRLDVEARANQWNRISPEALKMDADVSRIVPPEYYISLIQSVMRNGYIPITDGEGRLVSTDRKHLTKFGAILFGEKVLLDSPLGAALHQKGVRTTRDRSP